ncbi:hypothetical protein JTE90_003937 [Oedothorax gibbosus]|uniref:Uncharacterized protein n=1 Tax=Oedothorax gibbosus TaxID=931172 RepID=A0AAV6UYR1_9ARAC|nr:hypothetical protein JTE90_003937 [Oedothorax gibbosus]
MDFLDIWTQSHITTTSTDTLGFHIHSIKNRDGFATSTSASQVNKGAILGHDDFMCRDTREKEKKRTSYTEGSNYSNEFESFI